MIPYIFVFLLLFILTLRFDFKHRDKKNELFWQYFSIIVLILLAGLRNRIGVDTCRYENYFSEVPTFGTITADVLMDNKTQLLWYMLNVFCKSFFGSFVALQLIVASLFHLLLMRFLHRTTRYFFTSLLFVFLISWGNFNFETIRESLCVVLFLNGLLCLKDEGGLKKYILICLPAIFIHWFSVIMIAIVPFVIKMNRRTLTLFLSVLSLFLLLFSKQIVDWSLYFALAFNDEASMRISDYLYDEHYGVISVSIWGFLFIVITKIVYPCIVYVLYKEKEQIFSVVLLLFIPIILLRMEVLIFFRFANYLSIILIVASVNILFTKYKEINGVKPYLRNIVIFFLLFTSGAEIKNLYFTPAPNEYISTINYDRRYVPYTSVFEEPNRERETLLFGW